MYTCWIFIFLHINLHLIRIFLFFCWFTVGSHQKILGSSHPTSGTYSRGPIALPRIGGIKQSELPEMNLPQSWGHLRSWTFIISTGVLGRLVIAPDLGDHHPIWNNHRFWSPWCCPESTSCGLRNLLPGQCGSFGLRCGRGDLLAELPGPEGDHTRIKSGFPDSEN